MTPQYMSHIYTTYCYVGIITGGHITGKATSEDMCYSGTGHFSSNGTVLNPLDPTRLSGGSSAGSAVLVSLLNTKLKYIKFM